MGRPFMPSKARAGHAVVIGASVTGLTHARVLADHFAHVTVVERDHLPVDGPEFRKALPQARHQHVLLAQGRDRLEALFPGFDQELADFGAPLADYTRDFVLRSPAGRLPRFASGVEIRLCRRIYIDWVLSKRLRQLDNVEFLQGHQALRLLPGASGDTISAIEIAPARAADDGERRILHCDLVVDASGRSSRTPHWLEELGFEPPREQRVNGFVGYATRLYDKPDDPEIDWKAVEISAVPTDNPRAAGLWEVENNRWLLTLIGTGKNYPPLDSEGFDAFARALPDPIVHEAIARATPVSDVVGYRGTENRWLRYEKLARFPTGLIVTGDAVAAYNPLYGQGMTVAIADAFSLDACLRQHWKPGNRRGLPRLARAFHRRVAANVSPAWLLATTEDLRWPTTEGGRLTLLDRLSLAYFDLLIPHSTRSQTLVKTFVKVMNMQWGPLQLVHPRVGRELLRSLRTKPAETPSTAAPRPRGPAAPERPEPSAEPVHSTRSELLAGAPG